MKPWPKWRAVMLYVGIFALALGCSFDANAAYRGAVCAAGANDTINLDVSSIGIQNGDEVIGVVRSQQTVTWTNFTPAISSASSNERRAGAL